MSTIIKDLGAVSAYAYAVEKGYTGTEEEFAELMADYASVAQRAEDAANSASEFKSAAQTAAQTATNKASEATTAAQTATTKAGEAQTSAQTASSKASEASQSASQASGYAQTAETAKTDAQTAKTQAETARDNAVTAKTAAETAQGKAEEAQAAAESVAESIPSDYSQLSEDVSDLKEDLTDIDGSVNGIPNYKIGKKLNKSGEEIYDSNLCVSEKISVSSGEEIVLDVGAYADENILVCAYTVDDVFVDYWGFVNFKSRNVTIPSNTAYVKTTFVKGYSAKVSKNNIVLWLPSKSEGLNDIVPPLRSDVDKLDTTVYGSPNYTDGVKLNKLGEIVVDDGKCVTDFVTVNSGKDAYFYTGVSTETLVIIGYDANKVYVDWWGVEIGKSYRSFNVPSSVKYFRFTFMSDFDAYVAQDGDTIWRKKDGNGLLYKFNDLESIVNDSTSTPPSYYTDGGYLQNKAATITALMKSCVANGDAFFFITDEHWRLNAKQSPKLIKYLHEKCNIPRLFDGGDREDGFDKNGIVQLFRKAINSDRVYSVVGNHEYLANGTNNEVFASSLMHIIDGVWNEIGKPYYYVDNVQQKIRYIMLQSFDEHTEGGSVGATVIYSAEELDWFENTALNVESGWTILIFTHSMLSMNDSTKTVSIPTSGSFADACNIIKNYNGNGTIAGVLMGHAHWDKSIYLSNGVPMIVTTCDKWDLSAEPYLTEDTREVGTIYEQAFDVGVLDKTNRTLTLVRIGNPINDVNESNTEQRSFAY